MLELVISTVFFHPYLSSFITVCLVATVLLRRRQVLPLPPGPRRLPILGNIFDFPKGFAATHWAKHKDVYGPLSSVQALGMTFVIINDVKIASDLLEKRSAKYSHRPFANFAGKLCGFESVPSMQPPGGKWRSARKRIQNYIGTRASVSKFHEMLEFEGRRLLLRLLESPNDFFDHFQTYAGAITLKLCFGYSISQKGLDPLVKLARDTDDVFVDSISGLWLVDVIPFLQYLPGWLPGMGFQKVARRYRAVVQEFMERPFKFVQAQLAKGVATKSFVATELENGSGSMEVENAIKWTTAALYGGGTDSSVSVMTAFMLAMTLNPEVVRKAQAEIDAVVGLDRLPQASDRSRLPYVGALLKEVLRWQVPAPMSLPRATGEDDVYNGYFIPKGSVIFPNVWLMCRDPSFYRDPFEFKPERFLPGEGREPEPDPRHLVFGFGRRVCPGKEFADATLFAVFSMILAAFNISKAHDGFGKEIEPPVEFEPGVLNHPKKFKCSITPRSDNVVNLIKTVINESAYDLDDSGKLPASNIPT